MRRAAALAIAAMSLTLAPSAAAAVRTHRCPDDPSAHCGTLRVPLDRTGAVKGTIPIRFAYYGNPHRRTPILALSGGPGQAGVSLLADFAASVRPAGRRSVVVLDQRGTGYSGVLRCRALEKSDLLKASREAARCAQKLGPKRDYYFSDDSVADIDALRAALGINRWAVYGVSYGTRVAALYAQRHPDRVDRLVLDSVVEPGGPDPLYGPTFAAIPRVLKQVCAARLCRSVTRDIVADTAKLIGRLARGPIKGTLVGVDGKRHVRTFGRNRLFAALLTGDFDESLRAELPTAIRSALRGDAAPIIRLAHRAAKVEGGGDDPHFLSATLYATTVCTEETFPWDWNADLVTRLSQARTAVDAMPDSAFYPFDRATAMDSDEIYLCSRWPAVRRVLPPPPPPIPDVPALLVEGQDDLRTPIEGAQKMAAALPHSALVTVPGVGHSVFGSDLSGCSDRALKAFFANHPIQTSCHRRYGRIRPDGPIPSSLRQVKPAATRGRRGRTVSAAARTVFDVLEQSADSLLTDPLGLIRGGGLRGGRYFETRSTIELRNVVYIPGVRVNGAVTEGGAARLTISGRKATHGHLRIRGGRVSGVLGGRRVSGRIRSLAEPARTAVAAVAKRLHD
ncbi:MAG TPA: alpha/beta fold hydrolase [Thermoleophilaceae bacterium]|nr:alpha/beta fold hydrolase [Thermoleophilaceae bacterium]